jgi:hypothetical protein
MLASMSLTGSAISTKQLATGIEADESNAIRRSHVLGGRARRGLSRCTIRFDYAPFAS